MSPTFESTKYEEPRIIIPLFYKQNLVGIQGRSLKVGDTKSVKYITVMINDDAPKIYGLDDVELDGPVYVTEGPFDPRSFTTRLQCVVLMLMLGWGISNPIWIYDNEPRNREIVSRIERTISKGESVVIWTLESIDDKDINDMVMSGLDVQSVIKSNTYSGLEAKLKFNIWKKI